MRGIILNLPNKITLFRIFIIPVYMIFAFPYPECMGGFAEGISKASGIVLFVLFVLASISDALDGAIARKYNLVTNFGKFLDPIADKLLVCVAIIGIMVRRPIYAWVLMIVLLREFAVTGLRLAAVSKGNVIAAGKLGKIKTATQMVGLAVLLSAPIFESIFGNNVSKYFVTGGDIIMVVSVVFTIVSGVEYIVKNKEALKG